MQYICFTSKKCIILTRKWEVCLFVWSTPFVKEGNYFALGPGLVLVKSLTRPASGFLAEPGIQNKICNSTQHNNSCYWIPLILRNLLELYVGPAQEPSSTLTPGLLLVLTWGVVKNLWRLFLISFHSFTFCQNTWAIQATMPMLLLVLISYLALCSKIQPCPLFFFNK